MHQWITGLLQYNRWQPIWKLVNTRWFINITRLFVSKEQLLNLGLIISNVLLQGWGLLPHNFLIFLVRPNNYIHILHIAAETNSLHFGNDLYKCILVNAICCNLISLKFVPRVQLTMIHNHLRQWNGSDQTFYSLGLDEFTEVERIWSPFRRQHLKCIF